MISKPTNTNIDKLSAVTLPVNYNSEQGLALLLSNIIVSSCGTVPYYREIPTAQFTSGNYTFPLPAGYVKAPYRLPMLEPKTWSVLQDTVDALSPVALYQIGTKTDRMAANFSVNVNPSDYTVGDTAVKPLEANQSVVIRVYKNSGVNILWTACNIANNGLTDAAVSAATELTMVVTNVAGTYTVTEWITPSFVHDNLSSLQTTAKNSLAAAINEVYDKCNTAGGDLQGTYPNPTIRNEAITSEKIGVSEIKEINIAPGSVFRGAYKDRSIYNNALSLGCVKEANIAPGSVWEGAYKDLSIPTTALKDYCITSDKIAGGGVTEVNLAPSSVWEGAYKDQSIPTTALKDNCITTAKIASGSLTGAKMATQTISARNLGNGIVSSDNLNSGIGVPFYDYVVYSDASLEALDNNITATNVLIKKGTWNSTKEVRITQYIRTITGEGGSKLVFSSPNGLTSSYYGNPPGYPGSSGPNEEHNTYTQLITNVRVTARMYAFKDFTALYNCEGTVTTGASVGSAPFYNCQKVIDCNCIAAQDGGKTYATKGCYNVRGCRQKTANSSLSYPHVSSYSGNTASSTYACANTLNGGWNE